MAYPSTLSAFTDPQATDRLNSPSHSAIEQAQNAGIEAVEAFVGTLSSTAGTLIYDIRSPSSNGGGHVQTASKGGTGQITFTKGDVLIAQSSSVLTKLAVGNDGAVLTANSSVATGIQWGAVPGVPTVRAYTSASVLTWNKPSVLSYIVVEVQAGGGSGGGSAGTANGGGGGGGGGFTRKVYSASVLGLTATVTIGAGGVAGTAGTNPGNVGGNSSFFLTTASSILAVGGGAGLAAGGTGGAAGGSATGGDVNLQGGGGGQEIGTVGVPGSGGLGGNSFMGGGGATQVGVDTNGNAGGNYGGGGGGGTIKSSSNTAGGAGAVGAVIITEY